MVVGYCSLCCICLITSTYSFVFDIAPPMMVDVILYNVSHIGVASMSCGSCQILDETMSLF